MIQNILITTRWAQSGNSTSQWIYMTEKSIKRRIRPKEKSKLTHDCVTHKRERERELKRSPVCYHVENRSKCWNWTSEKKECEWNAKPHIFISASYII